MGAEPVLTTELLNEVLNELGVLAVGEGRVIDVAIYGGAALTLVSNFRVSTRDVDAVADDPGQRLLERWAAVVAERRGWPRDWLNDQVFPFLSDTIDELDPAHHAAFRSYPCEQEPGLRIFVPTPEYLLAMKLMAMRISPAEDSKDLDDILALMAIVGLTTASQTIEFVQVLYPEARTSVRVLHGIDEIFRKLEERSDGLAPRYLGRGGPPPEPG